MQGINEIKLQQDFIKQKSKGKKMLIEEHEDYCYISDGMSIIKFKKGNNYLKINDTSKMLFNCFDYNCDKNVIIRTNELIQFEKETVTKYINQETKEEIFINEKLINKYIDLTKCYFYGTKAHEPVYIYLGKTSEQIAMILPVRMIEEE